MYGEYRVGEGRSTPFSEVSEAIVLTIEADHKRKYTLDQLKDLESKLVLITGSRDGRREKVEGFLNVSLLQHNQFLGITHPDVQYSFRYYCKHQDSTHVCM